MVHYTIHYTTLHLLHTHLDDVPVSANHTLGVQRAATTTKAGLGECMWHTEA
jgi:hypothetical protein